jgi:predicted metal-dependent hydrolase
MTVALPDRLIVADLEFTVRESARRRTVGITVDRDGSLLLHAPAGCSASALTAWAHGKRRWVYRKLAEKDLLLAPPVRKTFVSGEGFDYLGRRYRLLLVEDGEVRLERGRLRLPRDQVPAGADAVIRWYRSRAQRWLPARIRPWGQPNGRPPRHVGRA